MLRALARYPLAPAVWLGALALTGCEARERPQTTGEAPATADTGVSPAAETAQAAGELTDANIVALLDEANVADSTAGALASEKATSPEVKEFAKLMMREHHALRVQGERLAEQLNITPEPPADDPVKTLAESEMAALREAPKGAQFDRTYIEQEVAVHRAVLDLVEKAHGATENDRLKNLIEQAQPVLQKHLDRAEELQERLRREAA